MATAKARIKLVGAVTFGDRRGNHWKKGDTRIITDEGDILYFQNTPEFTVTMLTAVKPKPVEKAPVDVEDEDEDEADPAYTAADLKKQSKNGLVTLGAEEFALDLDMELKKQDMIDAILEAQEAQTPDEGED
jgi:hypothetical protein